MVYPQGNFVEASDETPFFQIGETRYGRPILVRAFDRAMSMEPAITLLFLSFASTRKASLSVGMPPDMHAYRADSLQARVQRRGGADDAWFARLSPDWGNALRSVFDGLPDNTL